MRRITIGLLGWMVLSASVHAQDLTPAQSKQVCADANGITALTGRAKLNDIKAICKAATPAPAAVPPTIPAPTPTPTPVPVPTPTPVPSPTPVPPVPVPTPVPTPVPLPTNGRVQASNLAYQGSFRVPHASTLRSSAGNGFDYGGMAPAFNPGNNTLFLLGHVYDQQTAELNIPAALGTQAGTLPVATVRTPFVDVLEGHLLDVAAGQGDPNTQIKGQLVYNGQLYVNPYVYYGSTAVKAHWRRSPSLTTGGTLTGPFAVGPMGPDLYTGYMALVPAEWQAALGGPVLTGNCCVSEVARTSLGPSVSALDPAQLGSATVSASTLVAYPADHSTLWTYGTPGTNLYFNGSTQIKGVVFPTGTSSVLFIGRHGLGNYCYGDGSACNDPEVSDKGEHAYPYAYYVWAYDAHDLAAVKAGTKQPWDLRPYAVWSLSLPTPDSRGHYIGGVAYDPATGRIFVSQQYGDGDYPVVHVYKVQ